ncbi:glycosyltransferase [Primorskyibacter sp. S187A]|uniref:glycosyltransferase n=1 Tax=Primorskyibacter sp. S187A TaxID=3415130 RepID=UPI003C7A2A46
MTRQNVVHLIDDATAGGVMRAVDYLTTYPDLSRMAQHKIVKTRKSAWSATSHKAEIIVSHTTQSWRGLPGLISLRAKNPSARLIHVEHSYTGAFMEENVRHTGRFLAMLRLGYAMFDHVVAVSQTQADWMLKNALVKPAILHVIPPMVDVSPFEAVRPVVAPPKHIGAIGRLERQKGFDILIKGFRSWPDAEARLYIYGDGAERRALQELAAEDARIVFKGHVVDPAKAMSTVSCIAMPSRWEAFGLVCFEAHAAGRAVICADVDGLRDAGRGITSKVRENTPAEWARLFRELPDAAPIRQTDPFDDPGKARKDWSRRWSKLLAQDAQDGSDLG